jgi:hypothetical protein
MRGNRFGKTCRGGNFNRLLAMFAQRTKPQTAKSPTP